MGLSCSNMNSIKKRDRRFGQPRFIWLALKTTCGPGCFDLASMSLSQELGIAVLRRLQSLLRSLLQRDLQRVPRLLQPRSLLHGYPFL